jgi:arylsulfatase A-like enzyme
MPQAMPGSTRAPFASDEFRGTSATGPYGDAVEELDWSTGVILDTVERLELEDRTLVIWTSDNGAPRRNPPQGVNLPLKGWGYDGSEGAMRVPLIARWPGRIPAGVTCSELCSTLDFHPTFAALAGTSPPSDRHYDGYDMRRLLWGVPETKSAYKAFYFYDGPRLHAVRSGVWKLYLGDTPQLFDLVADVSEKHEVAADHPDVVADLQALAAIARRDLGDGSSEGQEQRPAGWVEGPTARIIRQ